MYVCQKKNVTIVQNMFFFQCSNFETFWKKQVENVKNMKIAATVPITATIYR